MKFRKYIFIVFFAVLLSLPVITLALDREAAFRFPVRAYNDGNYRVAIRGFNQFIENFPEDDRLPRLVFWKGEAYRHLDEHERAYEAFLDLYYDYPNFETDKVILRVAHLAEQLKRQDEVLELLTSRLLQEVKQVQDYMIRWRYRRDQQEEIFSQLAVLPPGSLTQTATNFMDHFQQDRQLSELEDLLAEGRWSPDIWERLRRKPEVTREHLVLLGARRLWESNNYDQLINFAARVPENWHSVEFSLYHAEAAVEQDNYELAESVYRRIYGARDYREEIHFSLSWVLYKQGRTSEALQVIESLRWEQSGDIPARARRLMGDLRLEQGDAAAAQTDYQKAIEFSPDASFRNITRYWLGWSYFEQDKLIEAYDTFRAVSAEGPIDLTDIYQVRGRTALELNRYDEAERNYKRAMEHTNVDERLKKLRYELAQTYYEGGRIKTAFDILLRLHRETIPVALEGPVKIGLGRSALEVGRPELGWSVLRANERRLLREFPVEFRYFAGEAALQVGLYDRALVYFDELLEKHPTSPFTRPALRMSFRVELQKLSEGAQEVQEQIRQKINQSPADMRMAMLQDWAEVEYDRGNQQQAQRLYEEILMKTTDITLQARSINRIVELMLAEDKAAETGRFLAKQFPDMPVHPAAAEAVYKLIRHDYRNRNIERLQEWLLKFRNHFTTSPYHPHVYFIQAEIYRRENVYQEALTFYNKTVESSDRDQLRIRSRFRIGQILIEEQEYEEAYDNLSHVLQSDVEVVSKDLLNEMLAEAALEFENFTLVEKHLNQLPELTDRHRLFLARVNFYREDYQTVKELLDSVRPPEGSILAPEKKFWRGRIAAEKAEFSTAEELWYQILYLYPDWVGREELIFRLAHMLYEQGEEQEADRLKDTLKEEYPESNYLEAF